MSYYDIDPTHLRTHELNYELRIRNVATDRVDISLKRKFLRRELKKDLLRPGVHVYATPNFNFELEEKELKESISSVTELVNDFDGTNAELHNRIRSRISHLMGRLERIPENISEDISNYRGDNIVIVAALEEDLTETVDKFKKGIANDSTGAVSVTENKRCVAVYKWAIKFNGKNAEKSLHAFLQHIEGLRIARGCSKQELYEAAFDIFEDDALEWYQAQIRRNRFDSWETLVYALKKDFLCSDYDTELWKQIEEREQSEGEPVVIYISVMENLFHCLSEMPTEKRKLQILKSRVMPQYQSHLAMKGISSIAELVEDCRLLEEAEKSKRLFNMDKPGPSNEHTSSLRNTYKNFNNFHKTDNRVSAGTSGATSKNTQRGIQKYVAEIHCWRCNGVGHVQRDCKKKISQPKCYGCGRKDVIRPNCPSCSKNGGRGGGN